MGSKRIANQEHGDECTPREAKNAIRIEFVNQSQEPAWEEDEEDALIDGIETDVSSRVYARLKQAGWILELDDMGYRRITSFPRLPALLLTALVKLKEPDDLDIGSVCQGVYTSLQQVKQEPRKDANLVTFAAKSARTFYAEASTLSFTTRELAYRMMNQSDSADQLRTFFDEFFNQVFARDYKTLHSRDNPYRYRTRILSLVGELTYNKTLFDDIVGGIHALQPDRTEENVHKQVNDDLLTISKVFNNIHQLMEGMERYRRSMTQRTREAMRYAYRVTPDLGRKIDTTLSVLIKMNGDVDSSLFPFPCVEDGYIAPQRFYEPPRPKEQEAPTPIRIAPVPLEKSAKDRALKAYFQRRIDNPVRLERYIERHIGGLAQITTDD